MPLDGSRCNTVSNGQGTYSNYVMIQYSKKIVTSRDKGLSVTCEYDLSSRNVTGVLNTNGYVRVYPLWDAFINDLCF